MFVLPVAVYYEEHHVSYNCQCLKAILSPRRSLEVVQLEGIVKGQIGELEAQLVLGLVLPGFLFVPLKCGHYINPCIILL